LNRQKGEKHDSERFAEHKATEDARTIDRCQAAQPVVAQDDTGIGQGEQRHDHKGHRLVKKAEQHARRRVFVPLAKGDGKGQENTGQGSVNARFKQTIPHDHAGNQITGQPLDTETVEGQQSQKNDQGRGKGGQGKSPGVKEGDQDDCPQVVDDGKGGEKGLERSRDPIPYQGQHPEGKGNVRCHGNTDAGLGRGPLVTKKMEESGQGHAAEGGKGGQSGLARAGEFADVEFAFDFEPDQKKEHRHQPVVDPVSDGQLQIKPGPGKTDFVLPEFQISRPQGGIGQEKRRDRGQDQDDARDLLAAQKFFKGLDVAGFHQSSSAALPCFSPEDTGTLIFAPLLLQKENGR